MPVLIDLLYREYCRARLAEMRKQVFISPRSTLWLFVWSRRIVTEARL
jgi:hypothetical protein